MSTGRAEGRARGSLREPSRAAVEAFLERMSDAPFSYADVGATRDARSRPSAGFVQDENRIRLGAGEKVFSAARDALASWRMFPPGWTRVEPPGAAVAPGTTVAVLFQLLGTWWLNACRVVYAIDESAPLRRFGFAYGTVAHVERGEERFSVELHEDGGVWYDLRAFSRPEHWAARLAFPVARRYQHRFVVESQAAMRRAVRA